ncbi:hypothetical protein CR513_21770, partial [Mucuna pruriens]
MGSNRIKVGHLIINNLESNHFDQGRVRDHMHLSYRQPTPQYQVPPFQQQQQQRIPAQGNSPSLEDIMKQLATNNPEFQQTMSSSYMQF